MRIGLLTDRIPLARGGGATFEEDVLDALLDAAPSSPHEFVIAGPAGGSELAGAGLPNVSVIDTGRLMGSRLNRVAKAVIPGLTYASRALGRQTALDRRLKAHRIDVLWFVTPIFIDTDLPYIYTVWDLQHRLQPWFPEVSSRGRWFYREAMYRQATQRATRVIVANTQARRELEAFYGVATDNILCLPHPTPSFALRVGKVEPPSPAITPLLGAPFVFYPAQFWAHKNHITLLKALASIRKRGGPPIHAVLCGSDRGNTEFVRSQATALGVDSLIHFPGFVSRDDLVNLYRHALALVFPSFFGPENLPPLEAMALGCPVIAARVPGVDEQLADAAVLVNPADAEAWADAIIELSVNRAHSEVLLERGHARARAWTASNYVAAVCAELDRFALVRACWR